MFEKGEHVLVEMEITRVTLESGTHKYSLKFAGTEDYLDKDYTADQLIPIGEGEVHGEN
jgi:hypothetical protein